MRTAFIASRLAIPGFVLPFLFIYNPELLMLEGSIATRIFLFITILLAFVALNAALSGTLFRSHMPVPSRFLVAACAVALIVPNIWVKLAGGLILIIVALKDAQSARSKLAPHKSRLLNR